MKPDADESPGDDEVVDASVGGEPPLELVGIDARDEEVRVLRLDPEQLVADGAADDVGVELE